MTSHLRFPKLLFILFFLLSCSCKNDNNNPDPGNGNGNSSHEFAFGVDLSYVNQVEDRGGNYMENGVQADPFELLQKHGANTVRLRLWHDPQWVQNFYDGNVPLYSGYEDVEKSIRRAKDAGMKVLLDFHYSDTWADPGKQEVPAAWSHIKDIDILADSVYNYTRFVLNKLLSKGLLPELVQIGNETNCGMLITDVPAGFPALNVCQGNWQNFGKVVNAAIDAVRDIDALAGKSTLIALHVADPSNLEWWLSDVISKARVLDFDVMGFSYYHIWHKTVSFQALPGLIKQLKATYKREFMLLETAYAFTNANNDNYPNIFSTQLPLPGFPYTVDGQRDFMIALTQNMKDAGAIGVFYWEPAWISSNLVDLWGKGSSWDNCTFFNFSGNLTGVVEYMSMDYK